MKNPDTKSYIAILLVILIGAALILAGSQGGVKAAGVPVFALLLILAFAIQWAAFIPAYTRRTEKFFDLTGSLTYITLMLFALLFSPAPDPRSLLLAVLVVVWAARLGSFLFMRIRAAGEDRRFRDIKRSFARFLLTWTLQGLWISFTVAAALAAITSSLRVELGFPALIGLLVWVFGFAIEVIADRQKSQFKADPKNAGKFIQSGLWSRSRHPNYFGEIVLWIGVAIIALPALRGWQLLTLISPVFVALLLTRISGIPMLEKRADEKWGGQADYKAYKNSTPALLPRLLPKR